ncbi:MAG: HAMP domain-containing histidine kinase [bacterium]|nr:HAMP domain-containing histidine kinase [bacterium]
MTLQAIKRIDAVYLLIAVMFVVLPFLATLQFTWLNKMAKTQLDRTLFVYQSDAEEAAASASYDIERIYQSAKYHAIPRSFEDIDLLYSNVYKFGAEKLDSGMEKWISDSFLLRFFENGPPKLMRYSPDQKKLITVEVSELSTVVDYFSQFPAAPYFGNEYVPVGFFGETMALVFPLVDPALHASEFGCLVMVIDQEFYSEQILRPLNHQFNCKTQTPDLSLAVIDSLSQSMLFSSDPGFKMEDYDATEISAKMFRIQERVILVDSDQTTATDSPATKEIVPRVPHPKIGSPGQFSLLIRHPDGSFASHVSSLHQRNILLGATVFLVLAASFILLAVIARRATRLTRLQQDFIGGVSHELRTPLAVISAAGENLADDVIQDPASIRKYGTLIQKEGRRLHNMVEGVLQFTRLQVTNETNNTTNIDLADLIAEILDQFNHQLEEAKFTVEREFQTELPPVFGDRSALGIALGNLISNAIKYGKENPWLKISTQVQKNNVVVTISDLGPGIDPQERKKIFQPFYRTQATREAQIPGSGLGLNIVAGIISRHHGQVEQENNPNGGCSFSVFLPISKSDDGVKS